MAKKEMSVADVDKFVAGYAKKHEISEAEAKRRILATGVSRLKALQTHAQNQGGSAAPKKAAKKTAAKKAPAKKAATKKAAKKAPKKAAKKAAAPAAVSEGEEG